MAKIAVAFISLCTVIQTIGVSAEVRVHPYNDSFCSYYGGNPESTNVDGLPSATCGPPSYLYRPDPNQAVPSQGVVLQRAKELRDRSGATVFESSEIRTYLNERDLKIAKVEEDFAAHKASMAELLGEAVEKSIKANMIQVLKNLMRDDEQFRKEVQDILKK